MIALLNFCHHDRDQALRLLKWTGRLGGVKGHDLILHYTQTVKAHGSHLELEEEAKKHFASVSCIDIVGEDERGWPFSPNHCWKNAQRVVMEKIQKPWLWWEADAVPIKPTWLNELEAEYTKSAKPFMGAEIIAPAHRMSGIGIYPPMVVAYLKRRFIPDLIRKEAFDSFFATEIVPNTHFTKLIQNIWLTQKQPPLLPTFPDRESLMQILPETLLFHRCKDETLITRLSENLVGEPVAATSVKVEPQISIRESELLAEIARLKLAQLPTKTTTKKVRFQKKRRTPEEQAVIDQRMANARAGRKKSGVSMAS